MTVLDEISDLISREEDLCGLQLSLPFEEAQVLLLEQFRQRRFGPEWVGIWLAYRVTGSGPYDVEPDAESGLFVLHFSRYYEQRAEDQIRRLVGEQHAS